MDFDLVWFIVSYNWQLIRSERPWEAHTLAGHSQLYLPWLWPTHEFLEDQKVAKSVARELRADEAEHDFFWGWAAVVETGVLLSDAPPKMVWLFLENILWCQNYPA